MSSKRGKAIVVGAGVFGATTALELRRRGWEALLLDPGPLPHPRAASTDISKVVRLAYGADEFYTELMEEAMPIWREWNGRWPEPLFHETGVLMMTRTSMLPGEFEFESFRILEKRGRRPLRVTQADLRRRFPGWRAQPYVDGFYHPEGGYAESARVMEKILQWARVEGVSVRPEIRCAGLLETGGRVTGVVSGEGERLTADCVIVATGAWTADLLPGLAGHLRPSAHPVFHFKPPNTRLYGPRLFPVFTADISRTGWYGFPLNRDGLVKIARHDPGRILDPNGSREVTAEEEFSVRRFLEDTFPTLAPLPIVEKRLCFYCDTRDEHFWIDGDPERPGLVVASGDSGHAFKFAPVLGRIIADVAEEKPSPIRRRFRWRPEIPVARGQEESRWHG